MTYRIRFHPLVARDLDAIAQWILDYAGPDIAARKLAEIKAAIATLRDTPHKGSLRPEIALGLRAIPAGRKAVIAFVVDDDAAEVLIYAVTYGDADWAPRNEGRSRLRRARPQADGRARVHAAVRLPRSGRSSPVAAFLTVQHQEPLSNLNDYLKISGEETVATISMGTAQAPFPTAQPEGCAHHTHVNPMAGVVQEAYGIRFQAIWATTSTTCTAHIIP